MATITGLVGKVEYPDPSVLPNCLLTLANGDHTALAGEVVASGPFFGLLQDNAATGNVRGLVVHQLMRIKKTAPLITKGDPIHFVVNAIGTKNDYFCRVAAAGEAIHGYAIETAAANVTSDILILGPLTPPFQLMPIGDITALLAILAGATGNQIVVADGAGGIELTSYHIPVVDGNASEILKTDGSEAVTWEVDAT